MQHAPGGIVNHRRGAVQMPRAAGVLHHLGQIAPGVAVSVLRHHAVEVGLARLLAVLVVGVGKLLLVAGAGRIVVAGILDPLHLAPVAGVGVLIVEVVHRRRLALKVGGAGLLEILVAAGIPGVLNRMERRGASRVI